MKKAIFVGLVSAFILSGVALAQQSGEQKKGSSMRGMMQEMMSGEAAGRGMAGMEGMMGQMGKMMDQCSVMMESMHTESGHAEEGQKK